MANRPNLSGTVAEYHMLCEQIRGEGKSSVKSEILRGFLKLYSGDVELLFLLLLPKQNKERIYHMKDKVLITVLAQIFNVKEQELKNDLTRSGCIAVTAGNFYTSKVAKSTMTLKELDAHLLALSKASGQDQQKAVIQNFLRTATDQDLFVFLRQVVQDLRLGAGLSVILSGLHDKANEVYKTCADIRLVVRRIVGKQGNDDNAAAGNGNKNIMGGGGKNDDGGDDDDNSNAAATGAKKNANIRDFQNLQDDASGGISVGTPIAPMLAAPSKGCSMVIKKCPNGAYSETKYDGERIQIHKKGDKFSFFSRNLKVMKADKCEGLEPFIEAAVLVDECILDGEILMVDKNTKNPLPFGTLGKHKREGFQHACACLYIFDVLFVDGMSLVKTPMRDRRRLLTQIITPIDCRVLFSEMREIMGTEEHKTKLLTAHLNHAITVGLEGLVIKDALGTYSPGGRHWIKLKRDYLDGCADTADMVVLGGWYGSGSRKGQISAWLMGVLDKTRGPRAPGRWRTVTKCGSGMDDACLRRLNEWFTLEKGNIVRSTGKADAPAWIAVDSSHIPDVFVTDPDEGSLVFEIMCTEFTKTKRHTANAISMRFPRLKRIRDDKDSATATSLAELEALVATSKNAIEDGALGASDDDLDDGPDGANLAGLSSPLRGQQPVTKEEAEQRRAEVAAKGGLGPAQEILRKAQAVDPPLGAVAGRGAAGGKAMQQNRGQQQRQQNQQPPQQQQQQQQRYQQRQQQMNRQQQQSPNQRGGGGGGGGGGAGQQQQRGGGRTVPVPGGFRVLFADVARPAVNTKNQNQNILIIHCVALKGKWQPTRGVMGAITATLGDDAEDAYSQTAHQAKEGDVVFIDISDPLAPAAHKIHIGSLYVMRAAGGGVDMVQSALRTALMKAQRYAAKHGCQVHFAVPDSRSNSDWDSMAASIRAEFPAPDDITLYARGDANYGHPLMAQVHVAGGGNTNNSTNNSSNNRDGALATVAAAAAAYRREDTASRGPQDFMKGLIFCVPTGIRDVQQAKNSLIMLGARVIEIIPSEKRVVRVPPECTHIVQPSPSGNSGITFDKKPDQVIVSPKWVGDCFNHNRLMPNTQQPEYFYEETQQQRQQQQRDDDGDGDDDQVASELPLEHCRIVFDRAALGNDIVDQLLPIVTRLGATVQPKLRAIGSERTTHFISTQELTAEARRAMDADCAAVTPRWVHESARRKVECDAPPFVCGQAQFKAANGASNINNTKNTNNDSDENEDTLPRIPSEFAATTGSFAFDDERARRMQMQQEQQQQQQQQQQRRALRRERTPDFTEVFTQVNQRDVQLRKSSSRNGGDGDASSKIFAGATAFFSGYPPQTHAALTTAFSTLGGSVLASKPTQSTPAAVLIIADTLTAEVVAALEGRALITSPIASPSKNGAAAASVGLKRMVVSRCWIDESVAARRKMSLDRYVYRACGGGNAAQSFTAECCAEKFLDNVALLQHEKEDDDEQERELNVGDGERAGGAFDDLVDDDDEDDFGAAASNDGSGYAATEDARTDSYAGTELDEAEEEARRAELLHDDDDGGDNSNNNNNNNPDAANRSNSGFSLRSTSSAGPLEKFRVAIAAHDESARQNLELQVIQLGGVVVDFANVTEAGAGAGAGAAAASFGETQQAQQTLTTTPPAGGRYRDETLVVVALTESIAAEARARQLRAGFSNPWSTAPIVSTAWLWNSVSSKRAEPPQSYRIC